MGDWNATLPTVAAGDELPASKVQTVLDVESALTGAWSSWTPSVTNLTQGTGTLSGKYRRVGKTVDFRLLFVFGASGAAVGTNPTTTLPVTPHADYITTNLSNGIGEVRILDVSAGGLFNTNHFYYAGSSTWIINISATSPMTWASGDQLLVRGTYEAA